jgi:ferric iron reductase protein FhuF
VESGPLPIAFDALTAADCAKLPAAAVAETLARTALAGVVGPMLELYGRRFHLPHHLLWGNVASALAGAAGVIARGAAHDAERSAAIVDELLRRRPLSGTAVVHRPDPGQAQWFLVRRNCCLYYRIPGGGLCGDCVLVRRGPGRSRG